MGDARTITSNVGRVDVAGFDGIRLKQAVATLRAIEQEAKVKQKWMATLMSFKGNPIDAGDLLDIAGKIMKESMGFEQDIAGLAAEARSLSRSLPSLPPKQLTLNKYTPSSAGELKDLQALVGRMPKQMAELRAAVIKFRAFALHKMNDPERTPEDGPMDPASLLLAFLQLLMRARGKL
jgi:hypothetical protein